MTDSPTPDYVNPDYQTPLELNELTSNQKETFSKNLPNKYRSPCSCFFVVFSCGFGFTGLLVLVIFCYNLIVGNKTMIILQGLVPLPF